MILDREAVLRLRYAANHLDRKLVAGSLAAAARGGLQDSAPWSGVLSLHARVQAVPVGAWQDPSLVQVFGPRGAIYLVPRADVAVFTLGQLPRHPQRRVEIVADAERLVAGLAAGEPPPNDRRTRWAGATGRLLPRWDARHTVISSADPPDADPEECRRELARRFLHYMGPATARQLAWFTEGTQADAAATLAAIGGELVEVLVGGEARWMLGADAELLAGPMAGVRLLPPDDPYLSRADKALLVPDGDRRRQVWPRAPAPGVVLVDGEVAGTWRRRGRHVTVASWGVASREAVSREVETMPLPGPAQVQWR